MIKITDKTKCSGCTACYSICPKKAITMQSDIEGFLYPQVNQDKCINCGLCDITCPYLNRKEKSFDLRRCFAAYNTDEYERSISSSGGIFILLAKRIIDENGVVFGAAFDDLFLVHHVGVDTIDNIKSIIGSKYLQSRMENTFQTVKDYLKNGTKVLFVGTSCQIGGLRAFLKKEYNNLICVDFICLGVPSPKVWKDYLETFFKDEKLEFVNFKNKDLGWHQFSLNIVTNKRNYCKNGRQTYFFAGYFKHLYSRPSCSKCIFKEGNRDSDITISDCWGYTHIAPEMDDNKGLSSIECHSQKGQELFDAIKDNLVWKDTKIEDVIMYNSNYCCSAPIGKNRADFWKDYDRLEKIKLFKKYCSPEKVGLLRKIKNKIKEIMKKVL